MSLHAFCPLLGLKNARGMRVPRTT